MCVCCTRCCAVVVVGGGVDGVVVGSVVCGVWCVWCGWCCVCCVRGWSRWGCRRCLDKEIRAIFLSFLVKTLYGYRKALQFTRIHPSIQTRLVEDMFISPNDEKTFKADLSKARFFKWMKLQGSLASEF